MTDNIFEGDNPEVNAEGNNPKPAEPTALPDELKEMVGEGKKYRNVEDALRSVPHAQSHISNLERELYELKEDLTKRLSAEEVLKKIQEGRKEEDGTPANNSFDPETLKNLVKETYSEMNEEEKSRVNIQAVDSKMKEQYGEKAVDVLKSKANELGVSLQYLQTTAAQSPKAFFNLIGMNTKQENVNQSRQGSVNTDSMSQSSGVQPHTYKWYQELRKNSPKDYYSSRVQMEMHRKRTELGDSFFK